MSANNHLPQSPRPCELAPHSLVARLEQYVTNTEIQLITTDTVSRALGISRRQAASLLRIYVYGDDGKIPAVA